MPQKPAHRVVIAANGSYAFPQRLRPYLDRADTIIACDGGATWLAAQGYAPDILMGDLDSIDAQTLATLSASGCLIERYPVDKDETDGELALAKAAALGATQIVLIGALGGRIDHELANILLLAMPQLEGRQVTLFDGVSFVRLATTSLALEGKAGDTVSLIPLGGEVQGITTVNLQYPLHGETLYVGPARGISNVMLRDTALVTLTQGRLLVIHTPYEHLLPSGEA